jgi:hypothetical protein
MAIPVTLLYGGANALLVTLLGLEVSRARLAGRVFVGDAPSKDMQRTIRAHGNAAEWVPLGIVMLLVLELGGAGSLALHVLGGAFLLGRILHATGLLMKSPTGTAGATINYVVCALMSVYGIYLHFAH